MTASPSQLGANTANCFMSVRASACTLPLVDPYGTVLSLMNSSRSGPRLPRDPLLSVVMPVYNERNTVEEIIRRVLAVPMRLELIVVDVGSGDGDGEIVDRLHAEHGLALLHLHTSGA